MGRQLTHEQSKDFGQVLARVIEARHPDISTTARAIGDRGGKVYLDFLQNGHGKTIAGPYSARPVPGATVSAPLKWSEVDGTLDPRAFTIKTLPARLKKLRKDPLAGVLEDVPDVAAALERLGRLLRGGK
jgi:bifunctional non-homologous end joining protein LigD